MEEEFSNNMISSQDYLTPRLIPPERNHRPSSPRSASPFIAGGCELQDGLARLFGMVAKLNGRLAARLLAVHWNFCNTAVDRGMALVLEMRWAR